MGEGFGFYCSQDTQAHYFLYPAINIKFFDIEKKEIFFSFIESCGTNSGYRCSKTSELYFSCDKFENETLSSYISNYKDFREINPKNLEKKKSFPQAKKIISENNGKLKVLSNGKSFIYIYWK